MSFTDLLALIRKLGPKLPQAWPHILQIMASLKAILAMLDPPRRAMKSAKSPPQLPAQGKSLIAAAIKHGVNLTEARQVAAAIAEHAAALKPKLKAKPKR